MSKWKEWVLFKWYNQRLKESQQSHAPDIIKLTSLLHEFEIPFNISTDNIEAPTVHVWGVDKHMDAALEFCFFSTGKFKELI